MIKPFYKIQKLLSVLALAALAFSWMAAPAQAAIETEFSDGFDTSPYFSKWDANGTTSWGTSTSTYRSGNRSAHASNGNEGYLTSDNINASDALSIKVDFWFRKDRTGSQDFTLYYYDGNNYDLIRELDGEGGDNVWLHYEHTITDPQYFKTNFRIRFDATLDSGDDAWVDDVVITKDTGEVLTVTIAGSGTVTSNPAGINCGSDCDHRYLTNQEVTLTAAASPGYVFDGWSGAGCSGTGTCTVTMSTARNVTATFVPLNPTLTVVISGNGSGTVTSEPEGINCTSPGTGVCSQIYNYLDTVTLSATPAEGSIFTSWSGACSGTGACGVTMNANKNVTAVFTDIPPEVPTGLTATAGDQVVDLSWDANTEDDLAGYNLYRSENPEVTKSDTKVNSTLLTVTSFQDSGLANGTTYYYALSAVDTAGSESDLSGEVSARPVDTVPPAAPANLTALPGEHVVDLSWDAPADTDIAGYNLYRSENPGVDTTGGPINTGLILGTTYRDSGLTNGTTYYYVVTAVDTSVNESALSNEVSAVPDDYTPPAAPVGLAATGVDQKVWLTWTANTEADLAGYNLYRGPSPGVPTTGDPVNGDTLITGTSYLDSGLTNGTTYYYVLTAVDQDGNESAASTPSVSAVPRAPTTYYVDNTVTCADTGTGSGTQALPFCTISRGATLARAGDTVYVLNGTYEETVIPENSGIEGFPVTYQADPGVTVTGRADVTWGSAFRIDTKGYIVIDGFKINNTRSQGIYVEDSHHITLTNNEVSESGNPAVSTEHVQGIYLRNTTHSLIDGNITHHNTCTGIRLLYGSNYNTISNNVSFANAGSGQYRATSDAGGIDLFDSSHNLVIHNITYNNEDSGINLYRYASTDGEGSRYNLVIGNLSYGNGDHGIDNHDSPYNKVIGNTVHGNGTVGINFEGYPGRGSHHATIANNIMSENGLEPPSGSFQGNLRVDSQSVDGTTADYNLFHKGSASVQIIWNDNSYTDLGKFHAAINNQEGHGREGDPLFTAPVTPVERNPDPDWPFRPRDISGDYHLMIGSLAIDSAISAVSDVLPEYLQVDIEGKPRVDDPATANDGAGERDYDDRGALEFQFADKIFTISGNAEIEGAVLSYEDGGEQTVTADENGDYSLTVPYYWSGTVTPSKAGYTFEPLSRSYTNLLENKPDEDFTATLIEYTLTVTTQGSGTVARVPDQATYHYGDVVTLTATADTGWTFAGWSGDLVSTDNPLRITIYGDTSLTATFTQDEYTLTVEVVGEGSVTKDPDQPTYIYNQVVELTATADPGWTFAGWSEAGCTGTDPCQVTMDGNKTVTATFTQDNYSLAITTEGSGSVTKNPQKDTYHYGDVVELTAAAEAGWTFSGWSGYLVSTNNPLQITIYGDTSLTATFTQDEYTLEVTTEGSGTVTKVPDLEFYRFGDEVTLTPAPATGWHFVQWSGTNAAELIDDGEGSWKLLMDGDKSVTAEFAKDTVTLTIEVEGSGIVEQHPEEPYLYGAEVTLTPVPDPGWTFGGWSGPDVDDLIDNGGGSWSLTLDGDKSLTATFTQDEYTLIVEVVGEGSVTKVPDQATYHYGDVVELTAAAGVGWTFTGWSGDLDGSESTKQITMDGDKSVTATFTQNCYTLTTVADPAAGGTIQPDKEPNCSDGIRYLHGTEVELEAVSNTGYGFGGWSGDVEGSQNPITLLMDGDKTVTATFAPDAVDLTVIKTGKGTVEQDPEAPYFYDDEVVLTAEAAPGWIFDRWFVNDVDAGSTNPLTIVLTGDTTVEAVFLATPVTLEITIEGSGTVKQEPAGDYHYDDVVTLTPEPAVGWRFDHWEGDLSGSDDPAQLTLDGDKSVTAVFTQIEYTLNITIVGHGTVIVDPVKETYHYGEKIRLIAVPDPHYAFIGWSGDFSWTALDLDVEISNETKEIVELTATFTTTPQYSLFLPLIRR